MQQSNPLNIQRRADRVLLDTNVRYRTAGSARWRSGKTVNISRSGMLFRANHMLTPKAPVDVLLSLPSEITGEGKLRVMCCGYVSRVQPQHMAQTAEVATAFVDFNLLDHTEQGRRTRRVLKARKRTRDLFHRLNNELQIILGTCEIALLDEQLPEKERGQLTRITQAGRRAAELVRQINEAGNVTRYKLG